jgi:hypothetical protein
VKYFVSLFTWIAIASCWPIPAQQIESAQVNNPRPADIRIDHDVRVENWRVLDIFLNLLRGTGLHGGFVEIARCSDLPKGRLDIKRGASIQQAMDALVAANPGYQWDLKDGVVNLMPRGSAPLLHTKIARFQMSATDRESLLAIGDVLALPEVRNREAALGLTEGPGQVGLFGGESHPAAKKPVPFQVNVQNLMLQDVLNAIAQATPRGVWLYHETDCNGTKTYFVQLTSDY